MDMLVKRWKAKASLSSSGSSSNSTFGKEGWDWISARDSVGVTNLGTVPTFGNNGVRSVGAVGGRISKVDLVKYHCTIKYNYITD